MKVLAWHVHGSWMTSFVSGPDSYLLPVLPGRGPDGRGGTADDGQPMTVYYNYDPSSARYVLTNPDGAWRRYDAVQIIGDRRYASGWSLQASYTWARTLGNFDNDAASNAASSDLASNGNFANPNRAILSTGRTVYDRRHDGRSARVGLYGDVFNVNNQDGPTKVNNTSGSAFGQPRSWRSARQFRGGVRVTF